MFYCPQDSILAIFEKRVTDGPTDQPTDRRTDIGSYRDAWTHLKTRGGDQGHIHDCISRVYTTKN